MTKRKKVAIKTPVRIRTKLLKNGRKSIYFDIRNDGIRSYKFLKMYLEPETSAEAKRRNAQVMKQVEALREELALELTYARAGLEDRSFRANIKLTDWMGKYVSYLEKNGASKSFRYNIESTKAYIEAFNGKVLLRDVDGVYVDNFIEFLKNQKIKKGNTEKYLSHNTVCCRIRNLYSALNFAVSEKLLPYNPCLDTETRVEEEEKRREYLTVDEVKRLIDAPCQSPTLKRAFLFSVFSALRLSDVRNLTWRNLVKDNTHWRLEIQQQKTQEMLYLPLNMMAREWLVEPEVHTPDDKIFKGLGSSNKTALNDWTKRAGITKRITYHSSRHSFAVMALYAGVDIYTVSKLMGHASIENTQVYANIINGRKVSTVALLDTVLDQPLRPTPLHEKRLPNTR